MSANTSADHASSVGSDAIGVVWLRPEYQGREDELVTLADGADEVGVGRAAVSNWVKRHSNFPKIVLLTGSPRKRTKYVVRQELISFARIQRNKPAGPRGGDNRPHRPRTQIAAEKKQHFEEVLRTLTQREERQAQALERTRSARRIAEKKLAAARARLDAEIAAVVKLSTATGDRK
ncbi:hypothetical protein OOK31_38480 [Streptomyces sp. NBC_00249]|uniref:hypothetical protein n=1 Tax=Streptomyces sp. NBC_00249 TaxID=2975690 RepID=UPI0022573A41|nr:hypothetical protein [Streptomyces sp. NBC_00249]MCX5199699.1 hypothetical protein [Streptomyces sp. NBC_00249]